MIKQGIQQVATNKTAHYNYFIEEKLECGIQLLGNEVKSLRDRTVSIKEAWVVVENGELIIKKMYIKHWDRSNTFDLRGETDARKLLAHKSEIKYLEKKVQQQGYTLVPLQVYIKNGLAKVEIGLCKGKHDYDKRNVERNKQVKRDIDRAMKDKGQY